MTTIKENISNLEKMVHDLETQKSDLADDLLKKEMELENLRATFDEKLATLTGQVNDLTNEKLMLVQEDFESRIIIFL